MVLYSRLEKMQKSGIQTQYTIIILLLFCNQWPCLVNHSVCTINVPTYIYLFAAASAYFINTDGHHNISRWSAERAVGH